MYDESTLTIYKARLENPKRNVRLGDQSVDKTIILTLRGMVSAVHVTVKM
jgi:hypothetical protein